MPLYLVRHPRPAVEAGICYGQTDLSLAEDPSACAARLLPQLPPGVPVFSSPLQRCRELAELLHPAPVCDDRLMEMHFGAWEMQAWDAIDRTALDAWAAAPLHFAPPGGESPAQVQARVGSFLAALTGVAVLITHAGVIRACTGIVAATENWMALPIDYGRMYLLDSSGLTHQEIIP